MRIENYYFQLPYRANRNLLKYHRKCVGEVHRRGKTTAGGSQSVFPSLLRCPAYSLPTVRLRHLPTAATRSPSFLCHRQRTALSPMLNSLGTFLFSDKKVPPPAGTQCEALHRLNGRLLIAPTFANERSGSCHSERSEELPEGRRALPGSVAFVPSVAGLIIAGEVITNLIKS